MVRKKSDSNGKLLTELELEIMNVIWTKGDCNVRDVQSALPKTRDLAYTTVATIMKILEQKGVLSAQKSDRTHHYFALLSREDYEARSLKHLTERVFQNNPSSLVMRLLSESKIERQELEAIRKWLNERLRK